MPERTLALQEKFGPTYKWFAGFAVVLGLLTVIFSSTMINVALTDIMAAFSITQASAQWMATAFFSASCIAMLTTAWLMNAVGARYTFLIATGIFIAGCLLGWLAPNFNTLILARLLQGVGAGITQPLSMTLVFILFPPEMRGRAMGLFGMGVVLGPALGPLIGGFVTDGLGWQMTFIVVIPLSTIAAMLGWFFLPGRNSENNPKSFNFFSLILITITVGSLLVGLSNSQFHYFSHFTVFPYLLLSTLCVVLFLRREITSPAPLIELRMFKDPRLISSALIGIIMTAGLFSSVYTIPLFARTVQSMSATDAGFLLFPAGIALVIAFPIFGRLVDMMPSYRLIIFGQVLFVGSMVALSISGTAASYLALAGWVLVGRVGLGAIMPSNSTYFLSIVESEQVTQASGALNFVRVLGGTIGVNLTALLITDRMTLYTNEAQSEGFEIAAAAIEMSIFAETFRDCFLVTSFVFAIALIPALYIAFSQQALKTQKSPAE